MIKKNKVTKVVKKVVKKIKTPIEIIKHDEVPKDSLVPTVIVEAGQTVVKGIGTNFLTKTKVGSQIVANGEIHNVLEVISDTEIRTDVWINGATDVMYQIIF